MSAERAYAAGDLRGAGELCRRVLDASGIGTAVVPVIEEEVKNHVRIVPDLAGGRKDYDPWANFRGYSRLHSPHEQGRKYRVWLPEVLQAHQIYAIQSDPDLFRDEFGRRLPAAIDMQFATDHRPPDFTLTHPRAGAG